MKSQIKVNKTRLRSDFWEKYIIYLVLNKKNCFSIKEGREIKLYHWTSFSPKKDQVQKYIFCAFVLL